MRAWCAWKRYDADCPNGLCVIDAKPSQVRETRRDGDGTFLAPKITLLNRLSKSVQVVRKLT